jgi:hypothetical protein
MDDAIRDIVYDPIIGQIVTKLMDIKGIFKLKLIQMFLDYRTLCLWSDEVLEKPGSSPSIGNNNYFYSIHESRLRVAPRLCVLAVHFS